MTGSGGTRRPRSAAALGWRRTALNAWMALERFEAPALLRLPSRPQDGAGRIVRDVAPEGGPLPWEAGHPAYGKTTRSPRYEWRHALHIGRFDLDDAYARVEAAFPDLDPHAESERAPRTRAGRQAALLSIALTNDGRPVLDSLEASGAAWSIAATLAGGAERADWLGRDGRRAAHRVRPDHARARHLRAAQGLDR